MVLFNEDETVESYNPLTETINYLTNALRTFNKICYTVFQFGNFIMFLIFLYMAISLITSAKDKEYREKLNVKNMEYLKKKGRTGTAVFLILAIGFLFKLLSIFILWALSFLPIPMIFQWLGLQDYYTIETNLKKIYSYNVYETGILFFICLMSFSSLILFVLGIYLTFFNKQILRTKLKPFNLLFTGLLGGFLFGFTPGFWLLI